MSQATIKLLQKLVPNSVAYYKFGMLTWEPPRKPYVLSGKKQKGDGGQGEKQEALLTVEVPIWLKGTVTRPWVIEDNKDGIKFREEAEGWRISHVHFLNAGEDCVTNYARGGLIEHCTFAGDEESDKCLQLNVASGLVIRRCLFYRFITGIQAGLTDYAHETDECIVDSCEFDDVETPIKAVVGTVRYRNCTFGDMKTGNVETDGGRLIAL